MTDIEPWMWEKESYKWRARALRAELERDEARDHRAQLERDLHDARRAAAAWKASAQWHRKRHYECVDYVENYDRGDLRDLTPAQMYREARHE